ncbi:MAG: IS630 family transposase, partial [Reyranella sp.]|nr:IS630 family transposase [Reyranella sp.]
LRKAARRTEQAVYDAIADLLPDVSSTECANYFAEAGYART